MNIKLEKEVQRKKEAREIVKKILDFGVTENQKLDIMFNLALTLESRNAFDEIVEVLKKYKVDINKEENSNYTKNSKKILT